MKHSQPLLLSPKAWQSECCVALAAVALLTAAPAFGASACVGDCDQSEQVTVNEILEMVNIALGLDAIAMCAAGDANEDGSITVDEILKAVNLALTRCPLTGSDAGEAAGGVDESTHDAVDAAGRVVGFGTFGPGSGGAAGILTSCPNGGTVDVPKCESSSRSSTRTVRFAACREIDQQTQAATVRTGMVTQVIGAPNVCATGVIPRTAPVTFRFTKFAATTLAASGETITQIDALTDVFSPSNAGCGGTNGKETLDGVLMVQRDKGVPVASYAYGSFVVETQSVVGSAACIVSKLVMGRSSWTTASPAAPSVRLPGIS